MDEVLAIALERPLPTLPIDPVAEVEPDLSADVTQDSKLTN
jgi:hypothetical protein